MSHNTALYCIAVKNQTYLICPNGIQPDVYIMTQTQSTWHPEIST